MQKILVAVDGSEVSMKAAARAGMLAGKLGARLALLHVVPDASVPSGIAEWAKAEHVANPPRWLYEQGVADGILNAAEDRARDAGATQMERLVDRGAAARHIVEHAAAIGADLIVMGTRGLGDLGGLVLGSVAHKVIHSAPCDVLTVKG